MDISRGSDPGSPPPDGTPGFPDLGFELLDQAPGVAWELCVSVLAASPYRTLQNVVEAAKAAPEKIRAGMTGYLSTGHFANLEFQRAAGIRLATVNFQGGGPQVTALLGGHIDLAFNSLGETWGTARRRQRGSSAS